MLLKVILLLLMAVSPVKDVPAGSSADSQPSVNL
jgi:hypothetical protein